MEDFRVIQDLINEMMPVLMTLEQVVREVAVLLF